MSARAAVCLAILVSLPVAAADVVVFAGPEHTRAWLEEQDWWGEFSDESLPASPRLLLTGIHPSWQWTSQDLPVSEKKWLFYRLVLPLIIRANEMVLQQRAELSGVRSRLDAGIRPSASDMQLLRSALVRLRIVEDAQAQELQPSSPELAEGLDEALHRLDIIPNGLALGQAAYESGYGTSRFAVEGNALFGQWTFNRKGMIPEEQREALGDHRIAAFDWPFDSVRAYFLNLMSHPAYAEFRRLRAELRARGEPLESLVLADGLVSYSELGQEYVDTLKDIIRVNGLSEADGLGFRDEPTRYAVAAGTPENAKVVRRRLDTLRRTDEFHRIAARLRLD